MSAQSPLSTSMVRSPRKMPPGPIVSPTGWSMPYSRGIMMSCV